MSDVVLRAFVYGCVGVLALWVVSVAGFIGRQVVGMLVRRGKR